MQSCEVWKIRIIVVVSCFSAVCLLLAILRDIASLIQCKVVCLFLFSPILLSAAGHRKNFPLVVLAQEYKPHTNIERHMHVTVMKRNTKFIQTWYNQTLDYVCMIFKFNLKEDCIYFVCNLSYVWLLYMAWYFYGHCMKFVWGLYALCMKYEFCISFEFFDGSHILYYHPF